MISTDHQGITLLPLSRSRAAFDFAGDGKLTHTGWIGANTGFLVLDKNGNHVIDNGSELLTFAELSALDTNHDGKIDAKDPSFAHLEVWVDANSDGETEPGQLFTLTQLGIASIEVASTPTSVIVGGNTITALGTLTFTDGATEAIDEVTFATASGTPALNGGSAPALALLREVSLGSIAQANGSAAAVAATIPDILSAAGAADADAKMLQELTVVKKPETDGFSLKPEEIDLITTTTSPPSTTLTSSAAPTAVRQSFDAVGKAISALQTAANDFTAAATAQETADSDAVIANTANAAIGSTADTTAGQAAVTAETAWQTALLDVISVNASMGSANRELQSSQTLLNTIDTLTKGGAMFATTGDALEAADASAEQKASAEALAVGEADLQTLLAALAQAWNASNVVLPGSAVPAAGDSVVVVGAGSASLTDGTAPSTFLVLPGAQAVLTDFKAGANGSRLDFLGANMATISSGGSGTVITVGSAVVTLANVAVSSLSLTDNLSGIGDVTLTGAASSAGVAAPGAAADLGMSAAGIITGVTAANAVATAGQSAVVAVTDTAANVATYLDQLEGLAITKQLASITLTDSGTPTLSVTGVQPIADADALALIGGGYQLAVSAVIAGDASAVATASHVASIAVADTAANVAANLDALQALAAAKQLASILLTDGGTPTLDITAAQMSGDHDALAAVTGTYSEAVTNPAATTVLGFDLGQTPGNDGQATIQGKTAALTNTGAFIVGDAAVGDLTLQSQGTVVTSPGGVAGATGAVIANTTAASGSAVNVIGAGSNWQITGSLLIGAGGAGSLSLSQGATVTATSLDEASTADGSGQIGIVGSGSDLIIAGTADIADQSAATMSILNGGSFQAAFLNIGMHSATGAITVGGPGTDFHITNDMTVGHNGIYSIGNNVTVFIDGNFNEIGAVNQGDASLIDPSTATNSSPHGSGGGSGLTASASITNNSTYFVGDQFNGGYTLTTALITGTGVLEADPAQNAGALPDLVLNAASIASTQTLVFGGQPAEITLGSDNGKVAVAGLAATINSFVAGDTIVVTTTAAAGFQLNGSVVSVVDTVGGATEGSLVFASAALASTAFNTSGALVDQVECFARGTRIATPTGEVAVEALSPGDVILTADGGLRPIRWIGRRHIVCAHYDQPDKVRPIRVRTDAFGAGQPHRDLLLSPDHAVFFDGVLIPVKYLVNGVSILQESPEEVEYFHIELDAHDILLAEGLPAESYLDTGDRARFSGGAVTQLHPDSAARAWEMLGFAPLVISGLPLKRARNPRVTDVADDIRILSGRRALWSEDRG